VHKRYDESGKTIQRESEVMELSGYNCPICKGKKGRRFNHEACSKKLQEQHHKKRVRKNRNYAFIESRFSKLQSGEVD
jgi:hypothetical protein